MATAFDTVRVTLDDIKLTVKDWEAFAKSVNEMVAVTSKIPNRFFTDENIEQRMPFFNDKSFREMEKFLFRPKKLIKSFTIEFNKEQENTECQETE